MLEHYIHLLNQVAAIVTASLANSALTILVVTAVALLLASLKSWSAASRYSLWWVAIAFVILAPIASLFISSSEKPTHQRFAVVQVSNQIFLPTEISLAPPRTAKLSPAALLLLLWALTTSIALARLLFGLSQSLHLKTRSLPPSPSLQAHFHRLLLQSGVKRRVQLSLSPQLTIPAVVGYLTPHVLLPPDLAQRLTESELDQVLLHELAHVARYDDWGIAVQRVLEALFFWHPVVRYLSYRLSREREMVCDDLVATIHEPKRYAECLAKVADVGPFTAQASVLVPLLERKSELLARVEMLLDRTRVHIPRASFTRLATAFLSFAILAAIGLRTPKLMASPSLGSLAFRPTILQDPAAPPVPPPPPASVPAPPRPPRPDASDNRSGIHSIVVTGPDGQSSMFGNWSGYSYGEGAREPGTIEYKLNGKLFVIRDKATVEQALKIIQPIQDLGRRQGELGEQQGKLGEEQGELGEQQAQLADRPLTSQETDKLNAELQKLKSEMDRVSRDSTAKTASDAQAQLAELQGQLAEMQAHLADTRSQSGDAQSRLAENQAKLAEQQSKLGKLQADLGEQQANEAKRAEKQLHDLIQRSQSLVKQVQ